MIDINKCKNTAKKIANEAREKLTTEELNAFETKFGAIVQEYYDKYKFDSHGVSLERLNSFNEWLPEFEEQGDNLIPLLIEKMVDKDMYSRSAYENLLKKAGGFESYKKTLDDNYDLGGEGEISQIAGCLWVEHWLEQSAGVDQ